MYRPQAALDPLLACRNDATGEEKTKERPNMSKTSNILAGHRVNPEVSKYMRAMQRRSARATA